MRALTFLRILRLVMALDGWGSKRMQPQRWLTYRLGTLFSMPPAMPTLGFGRDGLQTLSQRRGLTDYARSHSGPCRRPFK